VRVDVNRFLTITEGFPDESFFGVGACPVGVGHLIFRIESQLLRPLWLHSNRPRQAFALVFGNPYLEFEGFLRVDIAFRVAFHIPALVAPDKVAEAFPDNIASQQSPFFKWRSFKNDVLCAGKGRHNQHDNKQEASFCVAIVFVFIKAPSFLPKDFGSMLGFMKPISRFKECLILSN
jgi:hypothetical protein